MRSAAASSPTLRTRIARRDWDAVARALDEHGHARLPGLLTPRECAEAIRLYAVRHRFRSFIDMGRHRFGEGDYRYFAAPLPKIVATLRKELYARLAPIANDWSIRLGEEASLPPRLDEYQERCHAAGQTRPTPLLLHYSAGGYNCLHQDLYGALVFPLQVTVLLSDPRRDFSGGELLLVEQRPRMQSRGEAIVLERGEAVIFPCRTRPVRGARGDFRTAMRHGVSRLHTGDRFALGIIFHDAR
jgi:hypothetical protein